MVWCAVRGVWGVGCGVWGVGCGFWGVGCGVWGVGCGVYFRDAVFEALGTQRGVTPLQTDVSINLTAALRNLLWGGPRTALGRRERHRRGDGAAGVGDLWGGEATPGQECECQTQRFAAKCVSWYR